MDLLDKSGPAGGRAKYQPGETKLRLGDGAKQELDRINVHGKARKNVIKWHKKQVNKQMKQNPDLRGATTGVIEYVPCRRCLDMPSHYSIPIHPDILHIKGEASLMRRTTSRLHSKMPAIGKLIINTMAGYVIK